MSVTYEWIVPDQLLRIVLPPQFNDDAAKQYDQDVLHFLEEAAHPIHLVVDLRQMDGNTAPSTSTLLGFKHSKHPNLGHVALIGLATNPLYRFLASVMLRVLGLRMRSVSTEEEALIYLEAINKKS
jgi:hypothetical protein